MIGAPIIEGVDPSQTFQVSMRAYYDPCQSITGRFKYKWIQLSKEPDDSPLNGEFSSLTTHKTDLSRTATKKMLTLAPRKENNEIKVALLPSANYVFQCEVASNNYTSKVCLNNVTILVLTLNNVMFFIFFKGCCWSKNYMAKSKSTSEFIQILANYVTKWCC